MENTVIQRIRKMLKMKGVSEKSLASKLGVAQSTINSALKPEKENISSKLLEGIMKEFPDVNIAWLLTGEGNMLKNEPVQKPKPVSMENFVRVRFIDVSATASFSDIDIDLLPEEEVTYVLPLPGEEISGNDVVYPVRGESMAPQIPDGCLVLGKLIRPSQWHWARGVVILNYDNGFAIKRIIENHLDSENYLLIGSDNPEFPEIRKIPLSSIRSIFSASRVVSSPIR